MIEFEDAIRNIKKKFHDRDITEAFDIGQYYIFCVPGNDKIDYSSPYFGVEKSSGRVVKYSPLDDIVRFNNARSNHQLPV